MNDIFNFVKDCETISSADDTALIMRSESWELAIADADTCITNVANWLSMKRLSLNIKKTNHITYGSYQNSLTNNVKIQIYKSTCNKINCNCN